MGDFKNSFDAYNRALRTSGLSQSFNEFNVKSGDPNDFMNILKILLFLTVKDIANFMITRGCTYKSHG